MDRKRVSFDQLPDELLVLILSSLPTLAEIVRTSTLSRRWRHVWRKITCLDFSAFPLLPRERLFGSVDWYVAWVNNVINQVPLGVEQLQIIYQLDKSQKHHIDRWISFAAANPLQRLHLEFSGYARVVLAGQDYELLETPWRAAPSGLSNIKCLKSLFLSGVSISQDFVSFIISTCPLLEDLTLLIPKPCEVLDISSDQHPLQLRRLVIRADERSFALTKLCAPHLTSFGYGCDNFNPLRVDVPMLTELTISFSYCTLNILKSLELFRSNLPQLERLELVVRECESFRTKGMPVLVNLKFLKIRFFSYTNLIFHRIVSFISACPSLETIGLEFTVLESDSDPFLAQRRKKKQDWRKLGKCCSFEHLKMLEFYSYDMKAMDQKIVKFIITKAPRLKKLIVHAYGTGDGDGPFRNYASFLFPLQPRDCQTLEKKAKKLCVRSPNEIEMQFIARPPCIGI